MQVRKLQKLRRELQDSEKIEDCAVKFGTTGDLTRMKICYLLCHYPELSVSEIAEALSAPISTVSHSLKELSKIDLVEKRRRAKEILYSLSSNPFAGIIKGQLLT